MSGNELADAFEEIDAEELTPQESDCPCGSHWSFNECCGQAIGEEELKEALFHLFRRHPVTARLSELETIHLVEAATGLIWSGGRLPMHGDPEPEGDDVTQAELYAVAERFCNGPIETGYCMCGSPVDGHSWGDGHTPVDEGHYRAEQQRLPDDLDVESLIG